MSCDVYRSYRKNSVVMNIVKEAKCQIMVQAMYNIFFAPPLNTVALSCRYFLQCAKNRHCLIIGNDPRGAAAVEQLGL